MEARHHCKLLLWRKPRLQLLGEGRACQSFSELRVRCHSAVGGRREFGDGTIVAAAADQTVVMAQERLPRKRAIWKPWKAQVLCMLGSNNTTVGFVITHSARDYNYDEDDSSPLLASWQLLHMQTLYACKDFSAQPVESRYTGHEAPTSLAGANTLARDSSHASTRSRTRWWRLIVVAGLLARAKPGVVSQCVAATPYTQTSPCPGGQRLGVSSRELLPKLERLQRRAGVRNLFVCTIDNAIAAGCLRKEASYCMLPQIDRRAEAKAESQCDAVSGCAPARRPPAATERRLQRRNSICVAVSTCLVLAEENPNGYRWGMVLRMARCGTKRQRR